MRKNSNCSTQPRPRCPISTWRITCDYMQPPTCKKGNSSTQSTLHRPISTRPITCAIKRTMIKINLELALLKSSHNLVNDTTCDQTFAKKATEAHIRDHTARLAHGGLHVTTCNPPRAKKAIAVPSQAHTAQLAHDESHA